MLGRKDTFASLLTGIGAPAPVSVRETGCGFVILSPAVSGVSPVLRDRVVRFAVVSVWLAVIAIWLVPVSPDPLISFAARGVVSAGLLALACAGMVLSRQAGNSHAVHVDTSRRELRTAVTNARGDSRVTARFRFEDIGAPVLERGKTEAALRSLCLRLKTGTEVIPVAVGDETTLLAVHDRLMREMRPIEERMAARGLPPRRALRMRPGAAFPLLGPSETEARAARVRKA